MDISINYLAVLVVVIFQMAFGVFWHGPLLGKIYAKLLGMDQLTAEQQQEIAKRMGPVYATQIAITIITNIFLAYAIQHAGALTVSEGICVALILFVGFVAPTQIGGTIWSTQSNSDKFKKILIDASFQLIVMTVAAVVFTLWK
ncbi:MAG: DUF1761 domain-containing protein [Methylacidiphilales bacterium]|nr:DUF1761 domain-containing protein [Candidatus Methylacidiphilales bacterium]